MLQLYPLHLRGLAIECCEDELIPAPREANARGRSALGRERRRPSIPGRVHYRHCILSKRHSRPRRRSSSSWRSAGPGVRTSTPHTCAVRSVIAASADDRASPWSAPPRRCAIRRNFGRWGPMYAAVVPGPRQAHPLLAITQNDVGGFGRRPKGAALVVPLRVRITATVTRICARKGRAAAPLGESRGLGGLLARRLRRGHHRIRVAPARTQALGIVPATRSDRGVERAPAAARAAAGGRVGSVRVAKLRQRRALVWEGRGAPRRGGLLGAAPPPGGCQRREHQRRGSPAASFGHRARSRVYLVGRAPRSRTGIGSRSGPLALKFRQIGAAQGRSGAARRSPTHPSGEGSRAALATAAARATEPTMKREGKLRGDT